jgi:hypothetical protein
MNKVDLRKPVSIDDDFALWAAEQGALLRARKFDRVDLENLAEEIEDLGRSGRHEIGSRLEVLLQHLLKWEFQPEGRTRSWRATILEQRSRIADVIEESPSLRTYPATRLERAYILGRNEAITDTELNETVFPEACPYSIDRVLDLSFLPGKEAAPSPRRKRRKTDL